MDNSVISILHIFGAAAPVVVILVILAIIILPQSVRILRDMSAGRVPPRQNHRRQGTRRVMLIPVVDRLVRMDLRVVTIDVAKQEVMTGTTCRQQWMRWFISGWSIPWTP